MLVTTEQMMEIIRSFRQNRAPLGYRMMSAEQNDKVNQILTRLERKFGEDYLRIDDKLLEQAINNLV